MRIRFTLQTRFLAWFTLLLVFLVVAILLLIEKREVDTIFKEAESKAVLIARNMAGRNLQLMLAWDVEGILGDLESQLDETLLYAVFYDPYATPLVYNDLVAEARDIYASSLLQGDIGLESYVALPREIRLSGREQRVLEVEVPIFSAGSSDKWGSVKIGVSLEEMWAEIRRTRTALFLIGWGGFLFGLAGATLLARRITRPLQKLVDGTIRISKGDFIHRIKPGSRDEIGNLAQSFNDMTAKLLAARREAEDAQRRLVQSEKLAQIGRLAASIAHEIRNPLTSVKLNIQKVLEDGGVPESEREHLSLSQEGIAQIEKFIKEMLNFTRTTELRKEAFTIGQILDESIKMMRDVFLEKRVAIEKRLEENLPEIVVDGDRIRQVFLNLFLNAVEAVGPEGRVVIAASARGGDEGRRLRILVSDDGPGIPEKDWDNVFEPFFTTKSWGIGLGLANARKLVELHRGTIRVVRQEGAGTAFEILLPMEKES